MSLQKLDIVPNLKIFGGNSEVKQTLADCSTVSESGNNFFELMHEETNLYHYQTLLKETKDMSKHVIKNITGG
jgi:hypothetical protein